MVPHCFEHIITFHFLKEVMWSQLTSKKQRSINHPLLPPIIWYDDYHQKLKASGIIGGCEHNICLCEKTTNAKHSNRVTKACWKSCWKYAHGPLDLFSIHLTFLFCMPTVCQVPGVKLSLFKRFNSFLKTLLLNEKSLNEKYISINFNGNNYGAFHPNSRCLNSFQKKKNISIEQWKQV